VFMQCTSPLTLAEDVEGTIGLVKSGQADSAFTVTPFNGFLWTKDSGGVAQGINHDKKIRARRQDRPEEFRETGAVYAFRTEGFRNAGHRFFGKTLMKVVPPERCVDIDDLIDFHMAELLLKNRG
jgi:CMP-N-acetylneuraminic acid synthetase